MTDLVNNSGQGGGTPVVDIVSKHFNWGAFFLTWIWGLGNKVFITLVIFPAAVLGFIPFVGFFVQLGLCIWFGIKGNEWAWQNNKWSSIEEFHRVQRVWATVGTILGCLVIPLCVIGMVAALTLPALMTDTAKHQNETMGKKAVNTAYEATLLNEAMDEKCKLTSSGLAKCFEKRMNVIDVSGNTLNAADGTEWIFTGDGKCVSSGNCYIKVNYRDKNIKTIPLKADDKGFIKVEN